jgi:hypothetical protein
MNSPLVDKSYQLEKFTGKGGWTYASIPEVLQNKNTPFGWVKVKGSIDSVELKNYRLMPMGNGTLFLPVKAEIRKKINKKEGDTIHVILYEDTDPLEIPEELTLCLLDDPIAHHFFKSLKEGEQKQFIDWIYSAKKFETRINRISVTLNKSSKGLKFLDKMD